MLQINDILTTPEARIVLLLTILAGPVGGRLVHRVKVSGEIKDDDSTNDLIADFGELHHRGHLTSAEYRTIKSMLAESRQRESRDATTSE